MIWRKSKKIIELEEKLYELARQFQSFEYDEGNSRVQATNSLDRSIRKVDEKLYIQVPIKQPIGDDGLVGISTKLVSHSTILKEILEYLNLTLEFKTATINIIEKEEE